MSLAASQPKVLLIDSNVYFSRKLGEALKKEGFEVLATAQAPYALTMLEWNTPAAILCATNLREMNAYQIAPILRADSKTASIPLIAVGNGGEQALMEAFRSGCDDYVDRRRGPDAVAVHLRNFLLSRQEGFQPTQMVPSSMATLTGDLSRLDLPGVIQMLNQARQTGALNINSGETDGVVYFDAGELAHAECGTLFGDEAVIHILKSCEGAGKGVYKFVYGVTASQRTVLRSATDLLLDAMRELDESARDAADATAETAEFDSFLKEADDEAHDASPAEAQTRDSESQAGTELSAFVQNSPLADPAPEHSDAIASGAPNKAHENFEAPDSEPANPEAVRSEMETP